MKRVLGTAVLALVATACSPKRVDILERPPSGFTASGHSDPGEKCDADLRKRVSDEATYHCEARGRSTVVESKTEDQTPDGCVLNIDFSCGTRR